jgi:ADP-ribosylglycohydrolase
VRTSQTHPIHVDFLPREACSLPGRLGLTIAPGSKDWGAQRDLTADLERLRGAFGTRVLVSFLDDAELDLLGIPDHTAVARALGIRVCRLPVVDGGVPEDVEEVVRVVRAVIASLEGGETVILHCRAGLGRSGLFAGCCLVALGHGADEAIRIVRAARIGAVETPDQSRFVEHFARAWSRASPVVPSVTRFVGCLLGGALGDALGFPVEFLGSAGEIERVLGRSTPSRLPRMRGGKALISDDTQMTLFTAEGLIRARHRVLQGGMGSPEVAILGAYQRWLSTQTGSGAERWTEATQRGWLLDVAELWARRAPGTTCVSALEDSLVAHRLPSIHARPNDSKGCGAVMRSAPIGLVAVDAEEAFRRACDAAALTHGHPSGYLAAGYFAALVQRLARDAPLEEAMRAADDLLRGERDAAEVSAAVDAARAAAASEADFPEVIERLGGGWVAEEALGIALVCAQRTEDRTPAAVATTLWRAAAHGGDSDSTGSLTGNLLGAMMGVEALPSMWLDDLELKGVIESVARDLHTTYVLGLEPDAGRYPPG